ncbi:MAG: lysophospholipid acyltransferase family protein [Myxococcota bacterium]
MVSIRSLASDAALATRWTRLAARTVTYCTASVTARPFSGEAVPQAIMRDYFARVLEDLNVRVEAEGVERLRQHSPCILAANHSSMLDIPCVGVLCDFDYKWVSKREIFNVPFIGWHLRACGHIWVDRRRKDNAQRLAGEFHRVLHAGGSILIFPEGTRSENGVLKPFKRGAFATAVAERVPVVPIAVDGTHPLLRKGTLRLSQGGPADVVRVRVLDPIVPPLRGSTEAKVAAMTDATHRAIGDALDALRSAGSQDTTARDPDVAR